MILQTGYRRYRTISPVIFSTSYRSILTLIFLFLISDVCVTAPLPSRLRQLDSYVEKGLQEWGIPGLAVGVIKDGKIVLARGFGTRKTGSNQRVDPYTIFPIASNTKAFTCTAIAILVEEGKLKWDDKVKKHLPEFELGDGLASREITIRDLVSHRSGYVRCDRLWYGSGFSRDEILQRCRYLPQKNSFRSAYGYNNIFYMISGLVIERVSGLTWDQFVRERIFEPLQMTSSSTSINDLDQFENLAFPHAKVAGTLRTIDYYNLDNAGPCGSINSNVTDMLKWVGMHLQTGDVNGMQLLKPESIRELRAPSAIIPLDDEDKKILPYTHFQHYGLGFVTHDFKGFSAIEHGGAIDGFTSRVCMVPELNLGIVVLDNIDSTNFHRALCYWIYDAYMGGERRDWSKEYLTIYKKENAKSAEEKQKKIDERVPNTSPRLQPKDYAGRYENPLYGAITISLKDDEMRFEYNDANWFTGVMNHWHFDTYQIVLDNRYLEEWTASFNLNSGGKPQSITVDNLDAEFFRVE